MRRGEGRRASRKIPGGIEASGEIGMGESLTRATREKEGAKDGVALTTPSG